ncbi:prepilin-type N-terminal cleavage/methylation domain-containing protein [Kandleria vitulina]|nr:prepilin-type N-terminal cleavage/methylation domain-containing protein [Kandleria vitulina]
MLERMKGKKGFTLIEIIVVIVILAVLMAVAVPSVMQYTVASKDAKYEAGARAVFQRVQYEYMKFYMEHGRDPKGKDRNSELKIPRSKFKGVNVNHIRIHVTADHNVDALSATIYPDGVNSDDRNTRDRYHDQCIIFRIDTNKNVRIDRKWSTSSPILLKDPFFEVMIAKDQ